MEGITVQPSLITMDMRRAIGCELGRMTSFLPLSVNFRPGLRRLVEHRERKGPFGQILFTFVEDIWHNQRGQLVKRTESTFVIERRFGLAT